MTNAYNNPAFGNAVYNFTGGIGALSVGTHSVSAVATDWDGNQTQLNNVGTIP